MTSLSAQITHGLNIITNAEPWYGFLWLDHRDFVNIQKSLGGWILVVGVGGMQAQTRTVHSNHGDLASMNLGTKNHWNSTWLSNLSLCNTRTWELTHIFDKLLKSAICKSSFIQSYVTQNPFFFICTKLSVSAVWSEHVQQVCHYGNTTRLWNLKQTKPIK